jgi:hypothetical protein
MASFGRIAGGLGVAALLAGCAAQNNAAVVAPAPVPSDQWAELTPIYGGQGGVGSLGGTLTRDQLRGCVAERRQAGADRTESSRIFARLVSRKAALDAQTQAVAAARANLNAASPQVVALFDAQVEALNRAVKDYNAAIAPAENRQNEANRMITDFNFNCAARSYDRLDMAAVLQEMGPAEDGE